MKKVISSAIVFIFLVNILHSQEIPTPQKLHDISLKVGVACMISADTMPASLYPSDYNFRLYRRDSYLLKAAEFYSLNDYGNANLYITKAGINFKNQDLYNLSFVLMIGSYSNLKEIAYAAKFFYIAVRRGNLYPENMELIRAAIRNNFSRPDFDDALSTYFYYHERQRLLEGIYSGSQN